MRLVVDNVPTKLKSAMTEILRLLSNPNVYYRVQESPSLEPIKIDQVHILTPYLRHNFIFASLLRPEFSSDFPFDFPVKILWTYTFHITPAHRPSL
jgi:hypothetical protein